MRLSIEAFANSLMIIEFLNYPDNLISTFNNPQQSLIIPSLSRDKIHNDEILNTNDLATITADDQDV
ncbi:unnamed protein product [Rotaria sp. Silwood2]|nr:unnamed protein product [Rotaria sp. Silwood2]CAF2859124.1 unnamed protein product [Rotaria sp. Silwood2]CAF3941610.1 unnamed protein product [Rotaria sp. Silwood2]CAF4241578.1 unnamed protein product [Rotaria sp. Silwood2]